jgi:hypothetical protein
MSRRSRAGGTTRRPARHRPGDRASDAGAGLIEARMVESIRREIGGLAAGDELASELVASGVLSMWVADWPDEREALEVLGTRVLQQLARTPDADVLAFLLAVAALAGPPLDAVAQAAVASARASVVPEPIWSRSVGRPGFVDAWISTDPLDDQSNIAAVFAYERRPPHVLVAMTDANFGGLVRRAFVAADPDEVRQAWGRVSGMAIQPLSEQDLADRLGNGIHMFDVYLDPPVDDEARQLMPLLRSRLRLLPAPRPIEPPETSEQERAELAEAFASSPEAADLGTADRVVAADIVTWFIDFACDYGAGDPLRWSPIAIEILLLDWLPRKAIMDRASVASLPEVLRTFVRFAARRKGLPDDISAETVEAVDLFAADFAAAMADVGRAGPAKQIAMELEAAGIDLTDAAAVQAWIDRRNAELSSS